MQALDSMAYLIRFVRNGRIHEVHIRQSQHDTAIMVFEALFDKGFNPELWQGASKLR